MTSQSQFIYIEVNTDKVEKEFIFNIRFVSIMIMPFTTQIFLTQFQINFTNRNFLSGLFFMRILVEAS